MSYKFPLTSISVGDVAVSPIDDQFGIFGPQFEPTDEVYVWWKIAKDDLVPLPNTPFSILQRKAKGTKWCIFTMNFPMLPEVTLSYREVNKFDVMENFLSNSSFGFRSIEVDKKLAPILIGDTEFWVVVATFGVKSTHFHLDPIAKGAQ